MAERRVVFSLTPTYDTPVANLERIPAMVQDIIEGQDLTRFERAHFHAFGDSALMFKIAYWVLSPDHDTYMDHPPSHQFRHPPSLPPRGHRIRISHANALPSQFE